MEITDVILSNGIANAQNRVLSEFQYTISIVDSQNIKNQIRNVIFSYSTDNETYHERFLLLFVELIAIAQFTRIYRKASNPQERELEDEEIVAAFSFFAYIFNSFKHF